MMIGDEGLRFLYRGQESQEVEEGSPEKNGVAAQFGRIGAQGPQLRKNMVVDVILRGNVSPFEIGPSGNKSKMDRPLEVEEADQHGCLAGLLELDQSVVGNLDKGVCWLIHRECGDVALCAVREGCDGFNLDCGGRVFVWKGDRRDAR